MAASLKAQRRRGTRNAKARGMGRSQRASKHGQRSSDTGRGGIHSTGEFAISTGSAADHHAVQRLLSSVFGGPSIDAFQVSLEDPLYEPCDRLLLRAGGDVVGHCLVSKRRMRFGGATLPVAELSQLCLAPEYRGRGLARRLLRRAQRDVIADGGLLATVTTQKPELFASEGWICCGRPRRTPLAPRLILSHLDAPEKGQPGAARTVRPWRRVELPALMRLYGENAARMPGPYVRTEEHWNWLIGKGAFDQLYVALDGSGRVDLENGDERIAGYAVLRNERVLELMVDPQRPVVAAQLLRRACLDAIETDSRGVSLDAPADDPLHEVFTRAGGETPAPLAAERWMVRALDLPGLLKSLGPELVARAETAGLPKSAELGLWLDEEKRRLVLSRRSARLLDGALGRSYLKMPEAEFLRLLLGGTTLQTAEARGLLECSTQVARQMAEALFSRGRYWRPPLDELLE